GRSEVSLQTRQDLRPPAKAARGGLLGGLRFHSCRNSFVFHPLCRNPCSKYLAHGLCQTAFRAGVSGSSRLGHVRLGPADTGVDYPDVVARPGNGPLEALVQSDLGLEPEGRPRDLRRAVSLSRTIPGPLRSELDRGRVTGEAIDRLGQFQDGRLLAAGDVVGTPRLTRQRAEHEAVRNVLSVDEVPRRDPTVLDRQGHILQGAVDEGRRDVPPDGRRGAAPLAGAENLSRAVDVLEPGLDRGQIVLLEVVVRVEFADDLGDLVRAVEPE